MAESAGMSVLGCWCQSEAVAVNTLNFVSFESRPQAGASDVGVYAFSRTFGHVFGGAVTMLKPVETIVFIGPLFVDYIPWFSFFLFIFFLTYEMG
jgi:hypothetical protein